MVDDEARRRYRGKSLAWLSDEAQKRVNAYVRKRDSVDGFFVCISCQDVKPVNQMNAGHFYPKEVRQYAAVKFDTDNINGQCVRCNKYLSGNLIPYRENLIKKIGAVRFENIERLAKIENFTFTRDHLINIIERYKYK